MNNENIGKNYKSKRAWIKIELDKGNLEKALQKYIALTGKYKISDSGQIHLVRKPKQKPASVKEAKPKLTKQQKKKVDYNNAAKRENRKFVAQSFDKEMLVDKTAETIGFESTTIKSVKKALILPSEDLDGIAQFFEMGVFDENTQIICVEMKKSIFDKWRDDNGRAFGGILREAQKKQGKYSVAEAAKLVTKDEPILIHGEIGKRKKDGEWQVDLAGIDEIDFVWLDFMGVLLPRHCEWIKDVLRNKLAKFANVSLTAMSHYKSAFIGTKNAAIDKRAIIDKMVSEELIHDELLEPILENEMGDKQYETFRQDNVLIADALKYDDKDADGFWVRQSQEMMLNAEVLGKWDVERYVGSKIEMATHKFHHAYGTTGFKGDIGANLISADIVCLKLIDAGIASTFKEAYEMLIEAQNNGELPYLEVG